MSFLAWFFAFGALAIGLPLLLHLIRRTPRGRYPFSSLMFLKPSPPRLTRRSKLDDLLLLMLRGMVILLLVVAFMRPLWRPAGQKLLVQPDGRHFAILLDTSASMQRSDLWVRARSEVESVLAQLEPADDVSLICFDDQVTTVVDFNFQSPNEGSGSPARVRQALRQLRPSWRQTDLGNALATVADQLDTNRDQYQSAAALQIVLISDLQSGARLASLQAFPWPPHVLVDIRAVATGEGTNASLQIVTSEEQPLDDNPRVRVTNSADSAADQFTVAWSGAGPLSEPSQPVAFYVPAGTSRVLTVPRGADLAASRLELGGDTAVFDNTFYVVPVRQREVPLVYLGSGDPNDPQSLIFYLQRALVESPRRRFVLAQINTNTQWDYSAAAAPQLVVVGGAISSQQQRALRQFLDDGGTGLIVLSDPRTPASLGALGDGGVRLGEPRGSGNAQDYRLLAEIDFSHPLFSPLASARYNDFTKIHFWRHVPAEVADDDRFHVLARLDNGDPLLWQQPLGRGSLYWLASGWQPGDSQLALSSKFVPMILTMVETTERYPQAESSYHVGEQIHLPLDARLQQSVQVPGNESKLSRPGDPVFSGADQPGLYRIEAGEESFEFAVNVHPSESNVAPIDVEQLEQFGVHLGRHLSDHQQQQRLQVERDQQLENRQKIWKWLLAVALGVLVTETWLAGRRQHLADSGAQE